MTKRIWAIIPAAGVGSRMQADRPKQYLHLCGKPILQLTLERLASSLNFEKIVVSVSPEDEYWAREIDVAGLNVVVADGGKERCDSVLNGLKEISSLADESDWVLVHDAARPCVRETDIQSMIDTLEEVGHGGILAAPVRDTMKRSDNSGVVTETVDRELLWHALTPQVFRYGELFNALSDALSQGIAVTDEAMAIETSGGKVKLVAGSQDNIKVTRPEDLGLAELYLQAQEKQR